MKKLLLVGAGLAVLAGAGVAVAQAPAPEAPRGPPGEGPGPGMHEHMREHMRGPMGGMGGPPGMQMTKAARFHFSRGENQVDIRCAADEPTKACVDAASVLLDKLNAQPAR